MAVDSKGNIYVTGNSGGSDLDLGGGDLDAAGGVDIFLGKFDSAGNHLWSKTFGGSGDDQAGALAVSPDDEVILTGHFGSSTLNLGGSDLTNAGDVDVFLAKFNSDGDHVWSVSFGTADSENSFAVTVDDSGNILMSGGNGDVFLAKFDSSGTNLWWHTYGGFPQDWGAGVSVDPSGNIALTGAMSGSVDFGGGLLDHQDDADMYIASFDKNGTHSWSKSFGTENFENGNAVDTGNDGSIYLVGNFYGQSCDFGGGTINVDNGLKGVVVKFGPDGSHLWSDALEYHTEALDVDVDPLGNAYIVGKFGSSTINLGGDELPGQGCDPVYGWCDDATFILKLTSEGEHVWSTSIVSERVSSGENIVVDSSGNVYVGGWFQDVMNLNGTALTSAGASDIFLIKMTQQ